MYGPTRVIYNLNYNPAHPQKRVALVYLSRFHDKYVQEVATNHPSTEQHLLMLHELLSLDYVVDIYQCMGDRPYNFPTVASYDIILGFGGYYVQLCRLNPAARKILFITENAPWVVREKFAQRMKYYKERHHREVYTICRDDFYTDEMFALSDVGIAMSGSFNIKGMKSTLSLIYQIPVNAIKNLPYEVGRKDMEWARRRFVWFGSRGLIHKGLDILIDAFRDLPDCQLDIYGAPHSEISCWTLPPNVTNHGSICVQSDEYVREVVGQHAFVISLSCSEGMQSGIATCMMSGLIPLVTPETGYDDCPHALFFDDWHLESVRDRIRLCSEMQPCRLFELETAVQKYAEEHYTADAYQCMFNKIMIMVDGSK